MLTKCIIKLLVFLGSSFAVQCAIPVISVLFYYFMFACLVLQVIRIFSSNATDCYFVDCY